jgi:hypothetical protein
MNLDVDAAPAYSIGSRYRIGDAADRGGAGLSDWKNSLAGIVAGGVAGAGVGLIGFILAEIPGTHAMGPVMFLLVPVASGIAISMVAKGPQQFWAAAILATLCSLALLIAMHMETILCAIIALPLLLLGLLIGVALGCLLRKAAGKLDKNDITLTSIVFLSLPLAIWAGHRTEVSTLVHPRTEVVTSAVRLAASPNQVWSDLRSFDTLEGERPTLMYVGLPIPVRCVMQGSGLGAKRTCYFDHGTIEETVTEWSPPNRMGLSIDRTNMSGRRWLGFENAEYDLHADGVGTLLTRTTTITSNLYPAWYWRPFERWGVDSEHRYIFGDLALRRNSQVSPEP